MEQKLRFAPLIRVSTEKQEEQGESIRIQTNLIKHWVENNLNGIIPDNCWYSGQEHATPQYERQMLDRLLADSAKDKFDAIIVENISRWSRDNLKSEQGLVILREHGIRFFVGTMEYDLFNNQQMLFLTMGVAMEQHNAKELARKVTLGKISKAQRGLNPLGGKLPYARTFDKKTGQWGIDPTKHAIIKGAVDRYLEGESIVAIAKTINMDHTYLWRIFSERLGPDYQITITNKANRISETITIPIPPLFDDETIEAVKKQLVAKRTYDKGVIKYNNLLSRMIFCGVCGFALTSFPCNNGRTRYYKHQKHFYKGAVKMEFPCRFKYLVKADEIETAVLLNLVQTFGDPIRLEKAVSDATPDFSEIENLKKEQYHLNAELKRFAIQKDKIVEAIANSVISNDDARRSMEKIREQEGYIRDRSIIIENKLKSIPDPAQVKRLSKFTGKVIYDVIRNNPRMMLEKDFEYKQKFIKTFIGGTDQEGRKLGVYVKETATGFDFEIRGILGTAQMSLPLSDEYLTETFKLDPEFHDFDKELKAIKSSLHSL